MKKVVRIGTISVYSGKLGSRVTASIFCKIKYKDDNLSISGVVGPMRNGDALGSSGQIDMDFAHRDPKDNDRRTTEPIKPEEITFAPGWDAEKWLDFLDIWKRWHLNDMKAGCKHQTGPEWDAGKKIELIYYDWGENYHRHRNLAEKGDLEVPRYRKFQTISKQVYSVTIGLNTPKWETPLIAELLKGGWIKEGHRETKTAGWVSQEEHPEGLLGAPCPVCGYKYGTAWNKEEVPQEVIEWLQGLPDTDKIPAWV